MCNYVCVPTRDMEQIYTYTACRMHGIEVSKLVRAFKPTTPICTLRARSAIEYTHTHTAHTGTCEQLQLTPKPSKLYISLTICVSTSVHTHTHRMHMSIYRIIKNIRRPNRCLINNNKRQTKIEWPPQQAQKTHKSDRLATKMCAVSLAPANLYQN